MSARNLGRFL